MEKEKSKAKSKTLSLENDLMTALRFTEADLEANRDGQLSIDQHRRLLASRLSWTRSVLIMVILALVPLVGLFIDGPTGLEVAGVISFLSGMGIAVFQYIDYQADLREGRVVGVQGRIRLDIPHKENYQILINDLSFKLKQRAFLAFKNGDPYCLYYAPHSKTLLSAEWLRED